MGEVVAIENQRIALVIPVIDGHEHTKKVLDELVSKTRTQPKIIIWDNRSEEPYDQELWREWYPELEIVVVNFSENIGYYRPLKMVLSITEDCAFVGLMHNDLYIYEPGWDQRMMDAFLEDEKLGLIGVCGSNEVDAMGGRGGGTMCNFNGLVGEGQSAGRFINDLQPSLILDSMFMLFRRDVIDQLMPNEKWEDITLGHFYDRIWPLRTIEAGYRVATLGVQCDHEGSVTMVANQRYRDDCIQWLWERDLPTDNPETDMYLIAERRFLGEYREEKQFIPATIGRDYAIQHRRQSI